MASMDKITHFIIGVSIYLSSEALDIFMVAVNYLVLEKWV